MENRERLGSRLGFIMLSAGCAIGCGNVWKFPWMCGQNGGGSFMLIYVICLIVLGLPTMIMEFSVGRAAQTSPLYMYRKLSGGRGKWNLWGIVCLIGNIALIAFYAVVSGWIPVSYTHLQVVLAHGVHLFGISCDFFGYSGQLGDVFHNLIIGF